MPLLGDATLCFYRADLFRDPQHQRVFKQDHPGQELAAPNTWEDFTNQAEYFSQHREPGKVTPSLPSLPEGDDGLDQLYYTIAAGFARRAVREGEQLPTPDDQMFSFHYDPRTGKPRIDQPGFVHALKLLQRLQACRPAKATRSPPEAFRGGQAVLCLADPSWIAEFRKRLGPDAIGVCRVPGAGYYFSHRTGERNVVRSGNYVPYLGAGGWLGVVPESAAHPEAAFALLADLSGRETGKRIVLEPAWGGAGYRREHFDNPNARYGFGLNAEQTVVLVEALRQTLIHPGLKNPLLRLRTPDERDHLEALVKEVRAALAHGSDPEKAMRAVAERWEMLDHAQDTKRRINDYRLSLSLEPIK
jgi:multiple sugar transport system substrate-binding protein